MSTLKSSRMWWRGTVIPMVVVAFVFAVAAAFWPTSRPSAPFSTLVGGSARQGTLAAPIDLVREPLHHEMCLQDAAGKLCATVSAEHFGAIYNKIDKVARSSSYVWTPVSVPECVSVTFSNDSGKSMPLNLNESLVTTLGVFPPLGGGTGSGYESGYNQLEPNDRGGPNCSHPRSGTIGLAPHQHQTVELSFYPKNSHIDQMDQFVHVYWDQLTIAGLFTFESHQTWWKTIDGSGCAATERCGVWESSSLSLLGGVGGGLRPGTTNQWDFWRSNKHGGGTLYLMTYSNTLRTTSGAALTRTAKGWTTNSHEIVMAERITYPGHVVPFRTNPSVYFLDSLFNCTATGCSMERSAATSAATCQPMGSVCTTFPVPKGAIVEGFGGENNWNGLIQCASFNCEPPGLLKVKLYPFDAFDQFPN